MSGKVTGLTLNCKTCVIVVLNLEEKKDVLEAFRGRGLDVSRYQIQRSGKLLGIQVGERGFLDAWQPVAVKIRSRTEGARRLGLSFIQSAQAFNTYVVPVTSHVGQFYLPSKELVRAEREARQKLPRAPRHAFPPKAMFRLKEL
eukprot:5050267-Pyramimonas_sp.AAC.1